ncbi:hypothetical protein Ddye_023387 [Dipteronia dyeriana]|uniref:Uncharacterized protein n=1 Tax=Dipteronia dyeriana TaxID=168575 RepID=A0AAD9WS27_9ROSI|nr:hypothetical protein Ddye_023387 [Dipteronia dyeriana]
MEGLIPMVFKAIKKNKTRRQYECLSSGASQSYNIADFYVNTTTRHSADKVEERYATPHRRHKSVGDFYVGYSSSANGGGVGSPPVPQKLVRFRSQRMFSCVTGA